MTDKNTAQDHVEDLLAEVAELRATVRRQQAAIEQWWFLARQYRNSYEHARCLGNQRCKFCVTFQRNEAMYGNGHDQD